MSSTIALLGKIEIRLYLYGLLKIRGGTQLTSVLRGYERDEGWTRRGAKEAGGSILEDSARNRPPFDKENEYKRW
jgi:hypothetical protein